MVWHRVEEDVHQHPLVKVKEKLAALASKVVGNKIGFSWAIQHLTRRCNQAPSLVKVVDSSNQV